ncbi:MAG: DUF4166 domain-containing protein [Ketobacter sp.]|nr:MAG: DUF4166 domain-containing protein [Ketobacter sp.]
MSTSRSGSNASNQDWTGVWFVYDGDCPICSMASHALRVKQQFGRVTLLNAREYTDHPLLKEIRERQLDLDEGMVIVHAGQFYHGQDALAFMAHHGEPRGGFNHFIRLFRWQTLSKLAYPWMRAVRNGLLRLRHKRPIDNLNRTADPIFKPVFGDQWEQLPPVMKQHYAIRPYSHDKVIVDGMMDVVCYWPLRAARPFYRLMGSIPLVTEYGVRCTVHFTSSPYNRNFGFVRHFWFVHRRFYRFRSRMLTLGGEKVIEIMRFGFCWKMLYRWEEDKVKLIHDGYGLYWFGHLIPLPVTWLLGRGDAEEWAIDDNRFAMKVIMKHPLFGTQYSYSGTFTITQPLE